MKRVFGSLRSNHGSRFAVKYSLFTVSMLFFALLLVPFSAFGADKLVVKDSTGTNTVFDVTDSGKVAVGTGSPSGGSLYVYAPNVATLNDILANNQVAGAGLDIQTASGATPSGAIQAINGEFLIKYTPGVSITNNFNVFRMIARTDPTVVDPLTGQLSAGNFMFQHKGGNTASNVIGLITNVALQGTGNITTGTALKAASPARPGSGTISNAYGIDIMAQKVTGVTNGFGVYQEGANDTNYFAGYVGIGMNSPTHLIQLSGGAYSDGAVWTDASSRALKENINELTVQEAMNTLTGLDPVKFNYKSDKEDKHVGFIAEDVPELVAMKDRKGLSAMDIVAVLTKVVQEQQKTIAELKKKVSAIQRDMQLRDSLAAAELK